MAIVRFQQEKDNGSRKPKPDGDPEPAPGLRMSLEAVLLVADEPVPEELLADFWRDVDQWRPG